MKIAVYSNPSARQDRESIRAFHEAMEAAGLRYSVNREFSDRMLKVADIVMPGYRVYDTPTMAAAGAEILMSYGGDGTFMEAVKKIGRYGIPVIGVNSGKLGFLANIPQEGLAAALVDIKARKFRVEAVSEIRVQGDFGEPEYPFAFNEFSIQRTGPSMISVETYVDGEMVATYRGDGVILSTAAGSTAYALSVGGPVLAPGCGCHVLAPIAPHNLTMRPVVVPDHACVSFRVTTRDNFAVVALDNITFKTRSGSRFTATRAENSVFLVRMQNISFYDTLRNKMLWGIDRRDGIAG